MRQMTSPFRMPGICERTVFPAEAHLSGGPDKEKLPYVREDHLKQSCGKQDHSEAVYKEDTSREES